jgi:hypothetical protein
MGLAPNGIDPAPDDIPAQTKIAVHTFFAAQNELDRGQLTAAQIQNYLSMDATTITEYQALIALAPTGTNATAIANRARYINQIHSVFILAEDRAPLYSTPAEVRTRLGL